jgi:hypothetical protein
MAFFTQNRRFIAWFACLAILLNALAPAVSHAMAPKKVGSLLLEVCSATGNKSAIAIQLDFEETGSSQDSQTAPMQHCPYCLAHAGNLAVLHDTQPLLLIPTLSHALPELFYHAPSPLFAWAASQPRAPPTLS